MGKLLLSIFSLLVLTPLTVEGHGYLLNPPARGTAWRVGFDTPADYNDMANYCGGKDIQHGKNGGLCAVCGEDYSKTSKRLEPGPENKFATGTIVGDYIEGETIDVTIMVTAFHKGYFEFRLCENDVPQKGNDPSIAVTHDCLNKNLLTTADGQSTKFTAVVGKSTHKVKLPAQLTCKACVMQWRYRTGNSWGCDGDTCGSGFGPQEEFVGCSDIAIHPSSKKPTIPVPTKPVKTPPPPTKQAPTTQAPKTQAPTTEVPTTEAPTTEVPTTEVPTTQAPTTQAPTTQAPTTQVPTTQAPTTQAPTTKAPTTQAPTTQAPTTQAPTTQAPTTQAPTTQVPTTQAPTTRAPKTRAPTTRAPKTRAPTTRAPKTKAPSTARPAPVKPAPVKPKRKVCSGRGPYGVSMDIFCRQNCNHVTPYCPRSHCICRYI